MLTSATMSHQMLGSGEGPITKVTLQATSAVQDFAGLGVSRLGAEEHAGF
jgi:hypothetical protein